MSPRQKERVVSPGASGGGLHFRLSAQAVADR